MKFDNDFFIQTQGLLERSVRARREEIRDVFGRVEAEYKGDNTPVTLLDQEMEQDIRTALLAFDSSIGLYGEEYGQEGNKETFWLIDPIDGTENFVRGLPSVRNMVTLIDNNEAVFTFVYKPITDELYVAAQGDGAYKNGKQIMMKERKIDRSILELSMSFMDPGATDIISAVHKLVKNFRVGDFLQVPEGHLDGHLVYKGKGGLWDYVPRALLIQEAGGMVANLGSDKYDYREHSFLATHPAIFEEIMSSINKALESESVVA